MVVTLSRERGKETTVDYLPEREFADHRGIEFYDGWPTFESYAAELNSGNHKSLFKLTHEINNDKEIDF